MLKVAPSRLLYNMSSSVCDDASGGSPATTADSAGAVEAILADGVLGGDLGGSASTQEVGDAIVRKIVTIS